MYWVVYCRRRPEAYPETDEEDTCIKFLHRKISHKWVLDEATGDTEWYSGKDDEIYVNSVMPSLKTTDHVQWGY